MPSLQTARRVANAKNNGAKTIGQIYKEQSDWAMEQTFENDIATKTCTSMTIFMMIFSQMNMELHVLLLKV